MNVKDGYVLKYALSKGYKICIISGGTNPAVKSRLMGLGIKDVYLGANDKMEYLKTFMTENGLAPEELAYMGDDIPDIEVMKFVSLACCPQDAVPEVKAVSAYISHKGGGHGCVRDIIEQVLKTQHNWV